MPNNAISCSRPSNKDFTIAPPDRLPLAAVVSLRIQKSPKFGLTPHRIISNTSRKPCLRNSIRSGRTTPPMPSSFASAPAPVATPQGRGRAHASKIPMPNQNCVSVWSNSSASLPTRPTPIDCSDWLAIPLSLSNWLLSTLCPPSIFPNFRVNYSNLTGSSPLEFAPVCARCY